MAATNGWFPRSGVRQSDSDPEPPPRWNGWRGRSDFSASSGFTPRDARPSTRHRQETATTSRRRRPPDAHCGGPPTPLRIRHVVHVISASAGHSGSSTHRPRRDSPGPVPGRRPAPRQTRRQARPGSPPVPHGGSGTSLGGSGATLGSSGASLGGGGSAASQSAYASSVTAAWQRNSGTKRKRETTVRRSTRRQAQLTLARVEPWSVMKFSFVASIVAFIILFVGVAVLYMVLSALGVFDSLQHTVTTITSSQGSAGTNISKWFSASRILGYTGMLGALNIVLITAMSTIGAVIYNLIASTIGGVEVTLRETD